MTSSIELLSTSHAVSSKSHAALLAPPKIDRIKNYFRHQRIYAELQTFNSSLRFWEGDTSYLNWFDKLSSVDDSTSDISVERD